MSTKIPGVIADILAERNVRGETDSSSLVSALIREKGLSFEEVAELFREQLQIETCDFNLTAEDATTFLTQETAHAYRVMPVQHKNGRLWLATGDPLQLDALNDLQIITGCFIEPLLAREQDIRVYQNKWYGMAQISTLASQFLVDENIRKLHYQLDANQRAQVQNAPTVKLVDSLIETAVLHRASDIHIEAAEDSVRVRLRIDGQLSDFRQVSSAMLPNIISRLKIMGNMNITEKRLPQDGSFSLTVRGEPVDFRLSTLPTLYGEKAVIRLLYGREGRLSTQSLGFFDEDLQVIRHLFSRPHGGIVITGPTGCGKSTTLSAFLSEINTENVNIVTAEDPVENPIPGVNHVHIDVRAGLDFPRVLRHILRQDPDIIMIGEIRDPQTAAIATQAAITGHLVLSTLHTNNAADVFARLADMGVEPYLAAASLNGIIAQRLVRRLCAHCKKKLPLTDEQALWLNIPSELRGEPYAAAGCGECAYIGYKGRFALYEYIIIDEQKRRDMAACRYDPGEVENILRGGMVSILENGVKNMLLGHTSAAELMRVVYRE